MGGGKGGGGGGGGGDTRAEIRYAPYIESKHQAFLNLTHSAVTTALSQSPFSAYTDVAVDTAFFGTGYTIASFPSLYDMFGKFMAGLDIETLWHQQFEETVNPAEVSNLVSAESALLDDDIVTNELPRFIVGMRDINSVMASSFVIGKSLIEDGKVKAIEKFSADLKYRLIPVATQRWQSHLQWNQNVITTYADVMKFYYSAKTDVDEINYSMAAKDTLWPFTVLDFERANIGALQGATNQKSSTAGASGAQKVLGGVASGAALGASVGGPAGAVVGGAIGGIAGLFG